MEDFGARSSLLVVLLNLTWMLGCSTLSANQPLAQGTSTGSGAIILNPKIVSFGNVPVGKTQTLTATLSNRGVGTLTVTHAAISGQGFALTGPSLPLVLGAGHNATIGVSFTPTAGGTSSGTISLSGTVRTMFAKKGTRPGHDSPTNVALTTISTVLKVPVLAVAVAPGTYGALSTSDSSLDFSRIPVGGTNTLSETLTNTGGSSITVGKATVSGAGFRVAGLSLPLTLSPGQSFTFGAVFAPTAGGSATGSISVASDASNPTLTISLVGTATVSGQLLASPATLSFGSLTVGQRKSQSASLTASGSTITITGATMSTSEFSVSGLSLPLTLAAGKSVSFTINFTPQSSGAASASASFISNAANSSAQQSLTGSGMAAPQHSVSLSWNPSSASAVAGYNIYRGVKTGGPFSQINSMNLDTTYVDRSVQPGQTYFYVTTAVDSTGKESAYSNQTQALIPTP